LQRLPFFGFSFPVCPEFQRTSSISGANFQNLPIDLPKGVCDISWNTEQKGRYFFTDLQDPEMIGKVILEGVFSLVGMMNFRGHSDHWKIDHE